jgi:hypothetical protein
MQQVAFREQLRELRIAPPAGSARFESATARVFQQSTELQALLCEHEDGGCRW